MDLDRLLDVERRTGIKDVDIDDFLRKAAAVEDAIKGMKDGTIDPAKVKIEGIDTDEEIKQKEILKIKRTEEHKILTQKRKQEERTRWWDGAEIFSEKNNSTSSSENDPAAFRKYKYTSNYSHWDVWVPKDNVSLEEEKNRMNEEERIKNEAFEKSNPDFCTQFMDDLEERNKASEKKKQNATALRLKGNKFFKQKLYEDALRSYMEALKLCPYDDVAVLTNIAQVFIKMKQSEDALEFLNRALALKPSDTKALSRKAFVLWEFFPNRLEDAVDVAKKAHLSDPNNEEVAAQFKELEILIGERSLEKQVQALSTHTRPDLEEGQGQGLEARGGRSSDQPGTSKLDQLDQLRLLFKKDGKCQEGNVAEIACLDQLSRCITVLEDDDAIPRVYCRTSALLDTMAEVFNSNCYRLFEGGAVTTAMAPDDSLLVERTLHFLTVATCRQRSSKTTLLQASVNQNVIKLIGVGSTASLPCGVVRACLAFLGESLDEVCPAMRREVLSCPSLVSDVAVLMYQLHLGQGCYSKSDSVEKMNCIAQSCKLVREILSSPESKKSMSVSPSSADVVRTIAIVLLGVQNNFAKCSSLILSLLETLVVASQIASLRLSFTFPLAADGNGDMSSLSSQESAASAVVKCLQLIVTKHKKYEEYASIALAVLLNVTIQDSVLSDSDCSKIRECIYRNNVFQTCLQIMKLVVQNSSCHILSRAVGLMTRLTTIPECQIELKSSEVFDVVCRRFRENTQMQEPEKWVVEERAHLVRLLASSEMSGECLVIALTYSCVESLLSLFPSPRKELGKVSPQSVVLPPPHPASPVVLGNAARCFIALSNNSDHANILFSDRLEGVEKLINAMATCSDIRVRKNIAIVLAKGCRIAGVRERIEYFRGMEIIVALQKSIL